MTRTVRWVLSWPWARTASSSLDDALVVAVALRVLLRGAGVEMIAERWPGPRSSLSRILRLAGMREGP